VLCFFLRPPNNKWFVVLESSWPPLKTHFIIFLRESANFERKEKKGSKVNILPLFLTGATLLETPWENVFFKAFPWVILKNSRCYGN